RKKPWSVIRFVTFSELRPCHRTPHRRIRPMPYSAARTMADFLWPPGSLNYWKSGFLKELSDAAIDTIIAYSAKEPSPRTVVVLEHNGHGAMSRVAADATAFGYRNWSYNFL